MEIIAKSFGWVAIQVNPINLGSKRIEKLLSSSKILNKLDLIYDFEILELQNGEIDFTKNRK